MVVAVTVKDHAPASPSWRSPSRQPWPHGCIGVREVIEEADAATAAVWRPRRRLVALGLAGTAIVGDVAAGHAASSSVPVITTAVIALHVAAAGVWVAAILAAAGASGARISVLARVWRPAVGAAALVAATGVGAGALMLDSPGDLGGTGYGRVILLKGLALAAMGALGLVHHRRRRAHRIGRVRVPLWGEATAAMVAFGLAALLVGFPNPPRQAEAAERAADPVGPLAVLTRREAVSVADASGPFVVALTLLPMMAARWGVVTGKRRSLLRRAAAALWQPVAALVARSFRPILDAFDRRFAVFAAWLICWDRIIL